MSSIRGRPEKIDENYEYKTNRDKRAKNLKQLGFTVKRKSVRGQVLHTSYVVDCKREQKGMTYFGVIYIVEAERKIKVFGYAD